MPTSGLCTGRKTPAAREAVAPSRDFCEIRRSLTAKQQHVGAPRKFCAHVGLLLHSTGGGGAAGSTLSCGGFCWLDFWILLPFAPSKLRKSEPSIRKCHLELFLRQLVFRVTLLAEKKEAPKSGPEAAKSTLDTTSTDQEEEEEGKKMASNIWEEAIKHRRYNNINKSLSRRRNQYHPCAPRSVGLKIE